MVISLPMRGDGKERPHMGESILFQDALMQGLGVGEVGGGQRTGARSSG